MRWDYNDSYRERFGLGVHRDILIVPHATNVIPVPGSPPEVTSKVPKFEYDQQGHPSPVTDGQGNYVYQDVLWTITNDDIIKEKFELEQSLNSSENLTYSSCESSMVKFTIRNTKTYNEETGAYDLDVPNLQKTVFYDENDHKITGELDSNSIIKVYTYIDGDSSTIQYLGMYRVEEDKVTGEGYEREITAYDFMLTFREMDIFNWYKHLWIGININDDDFEDATKETKKEETGTYNPADHNGVTEEKYKEGYRRMPKEEWTVREALIDLFDNFANYDPIVIDADGNESMGMTVTNPTEYGRDYTDSDGIYSGLGMPIKIDPDILDSSKTRDIPTSTGPNKYECYGYMKILELKFRENPKIMQNKALSAGKFLEDIGILAGRYPFIRTDKLEDNNYVDPSNKRVNQNRYNNYERCILSFKPLPSSNDDGLIVSENYFDNKDIAKGFKYDYYDVESVMIITVGMQDGNDIEYKRLTKSQRVANKTTTLQTFNITDNMFASYLVEESNDETISKLAKNEYAEIRKELFGTQTKNKNMSEGALFQDGYLNIKYRTYTPYELTTYADPCREIGDRISVNFEDIVTGEVVKFNTYILQRRLSGIQKMMDTYIAKGDLANGTFSNYQTGTKYSSGSGYATQSFVSQSRDVVNVGSGVGVSAATLVAYLRNIGFRLLDEPGGCSARYVSGDYEVYEYSEALDYRGSWDGVIPTEGDKNTHGLMWTDNSGSTYTPIDADSPIDVFPDPNNEYDGYYDEDGNVYWFYTLNGEWTKHTVHNVIERSLHSDPWYNTKYKIDVKPYNLAEGDTTSEVTINGIKINVEEGDVIMINASGDSYIQDTPILGMSNMLGHFYKRQSSEAEYVDQGPYGYIAFYYQGQWYRGDYYCTENPSGRDTYEWKVPVTFDRYLFGYGWQSYDGMVPRFVFDPVIEPNDATKSFNINGSAYEAKQGDYLEEYALEMSNLTETDERVFVYPGFWYADDYHSMRHLASYGKTSSAMMDSSFVELMWSDPVDITEWEPTPAVWEGTVIVRKEDSPPLHRWDGKKIVKNTVRDKYKNDPYQDDDVQRGKTYYYGFFPYYTAYDKDGHPIRYYTFTKTIMVSTTESGSYSNYLKIKTLSVSGRKITMTYMVNATNLDWAKMYIKAGEAPSTTNYDYVYELDPEEDTIQTNNLTNNKLYYVEIIGSYTGTQTVLYNTDPQTIVVGTV